MSLSWWSSVEDEVKKLWFDDCQWQTGATPTALYLTFYKEFIIILT